MLRCHQRHMIATPAAGEDRWCVIAAETDQQWSALAKILGGGLDQDARFKTNADRLNNRDTLNDDHFAMDEGQRRFRDPRSITKGRYSCGGRANGRGFDQ